MAARNKPYDQFGPYILFKKLETDALGEMWRAGRIENGQVGATVALRRLSGGNREAVNANVQSIAPMLPSITGASFVRDQRAGVIDGVPFLGWEYAGGRSLRHIIDRGRGGKDVQPNPLPIDQAIVIAEKVALSLATMGDLRDSTGTRLSHGALVPHFIWISDDGEIRVAGQQLGAALMSSLSDTKVTADIGRYFSPEYRATGQVQKNTDVYSMGAILFLLVTGQEPPDAATASAFVAAVRAAKTLTGAPVPDDIRVILDKSFNIDPSMRYPSMTEMKQALSTLANTGKYSATTFNLAFYLSNLLKREMESEAADREKEAKVNIAPYVDAPKPVAAPAVAAAAPALATPTFGVSAEEPQPKSKMPLAIAATLAVAAAGIGSYMMMGKSGAQPAAKQVVAAATMSTPVVPRVISEPISVHASPADAAATATTDAEAQKKAFEDAVKAKMQAEMMKLQNDYMAELKQKQSKDAPVVSAPAAAPVQVAAVQEEERPPVSAAQLDQARRDAGSRTETVAEVPRPAVTTPVQTQTTAPQPAVAAPAPAPVQQAAVREGDVVDVASLDVLPKATRIVKPTYPPLAMRQKITATIFLTVLINENGEVSDVKVLRGDNRFGLNDAAIRSMRSTRFSSPVKDGKRVKTWFPQTIEFK
ncbi:MAG TPA: TonB family protein [Thermoanaerobaculia bacterium]|nr:TonB family protein [Thermoanaerobaculia bacterium]